MLKEEEESMNFCGPCCWSGHTWNGEPMWMDMLEEFGCLLEAADRDSFTSEGLCDREVRKQFRVAFTRQEEKLTVRSGKKAWAEWKSKDAAETRSLRMELRRKCHRLERLVSKQILTTV